MHPIPAAPRLPCPALSSAFPTCLPVCRLEIASPRPRFVRFVGSRTDVEPDNDRTDTPATITIDTLFFLSSVERAFDDVCRSVWGRLVPIVCCCHVRLLGWGRFGDAERGLRRSSRPAGTTLARIRRRSRPGPRAGFPRRGPSRHPTAPSAVPRRDAGDRAHGVGRRRPANPCANGHGHRW